MLDVVGRQSVLVIAGALVFGTGLGWLIGLVMGAGAILLLAPTPRAEVQATLRRPFKKRGQEQ